MCFRSFIRLSLISVFFTVFAYGTRAQVRQYLVRGVVYHDKNNNQQLDRGEKLLRGISVSNGRDIVRTDRQGKYELMVHAGQSVFPVLPADYSVQAGNDKVLNSNFFYVDPLIGYTDTLFVSIPLNKISSLETFRFGAIGDIQIGTEEERRFAAKSIFTELKQRNDLAFQMVLGDLVNDELSLLPPFKEMLSALDHPSWVLAGNHDRDVIRPDHMDHAFNRHFGASTYAFHYGEALFVVLNNVHSTGKHGYEGRYSEDQLYFLRNLTSSLSEDQLIIVNQHIPLTSTRNRDELINLLSGFDRVLVLSGHTHRVSRHFHGAGNIHELVVGAPSGTWWRGEKDLDGIPLALQHGGTPRNYFTIDVDRNQYRIRYKGVGLDANKQASLTVTEGRLIVNLFGGSAKTTVGIRINGGTVQFAEKVRMPDPAVSLIVQKNKDKIYPTPGNTRLPLREQNSAHIWVLELGATASATELRTVELVAEDDYGYQVHQHYFF